MHTEAKKKRAKPFYSRGQKYPHYPPPFWVLPPVKNFFLPPPPGGYYRELTVLTSKVICLSLIFIHFGVRFNIINSYILYFSWCHLMTHLHLLLITSSVVASSSDALVDKLLFDILLRLVLPYKRSPVDKRPFKWCASVGESHSFTELIPPPPPPPPLPVALPPPGHNPTELSTLLSKLFELLFLVWTFVFEWIDVLALEFMCDCEIRVFPWYVGVLLACCWRWLWGLSVQLVFWWWILPFVLLLLMLPELSVSCDNKLSTLSLMRFVGGSMFGLRLLALAVLIVVSVSLLALVNSYRHSEARQHICIEAQNHSARTMDARVFANGELFGLNVFCAFTVGVRWLVDVVVRLVPVFAAVAVPVVVPVVVSVDVDEVARMEPSESVGSVSMGTCLISWSLMTMWVHWSSFGSLMGVPPFSSVTSFMCWVSSGVKP